MKRLAVVILALCLAATSFAENISGPHFKKKAAAGGVSYQTPAIVNSDCNQTGSAETLSATIAASTSGNLIVVVSHGYGSAFVPTLNTGSLTEVITAGPANTSITKGYINIYYLQNNPGGVTTATINTAWGNGGVCIAEISGVATASSLDVSKGGTGIADETQTTWTTGASSATSQTTEIAIGYVGRSSPAGADPTWTGASGWTTFPDSLNHTASLFQYKVFTSTGAVTFNGSTASQIAPIAITATFKAAAQ